jgi:hypothetical protein
MAAASSVASTDVDVVERAGKGAWVVWIGGGPTGLFRALGVSVRGAVPCFIAHDSAMFRGGRCGASPCEPEQRGHCGEGSDPMILIAVHFFPVMVIPVMVSR